MKTPQEQIIELLTKMSAIAGVKGVTPKLDTLNCDENEGDSVDFGGLFISPTQIELRSIVGPKLVNGWELTKQVIIHGQYTLSNGDPGYPDEVDYESVMKDTSFYTVCKKAVLMYVEQEIDNQFTADEPDDFGYGYNE
jgi:hypothetical protein